MITGVCVNPCIDRVVEVESFEYGGTNRVILKTDEPGGKSINVLRAAKKLGLETISTGYIFKENGQIVIDVLKNEEIENEMIALEGFIRVNQKIWDCKNSEITELNESGPLIDDGAVFELERKVDALTVKSDCIVLSGSIPKGVDDDIYLELGNIANRNKCHVILDAEGSAFENGLKAKPFMVKPNKKELEIYFNRSFNSISDIKTAAQQLIKQGVDIVLVSLGHEGAMIVDKDNTFFAKGLKVDVKNTVGAGDSMVAGALYALENGLSRLNILKYGVACATASVMDKGTGLCDVTKIKEILDTIEIEEI